MKTVVLFDSSGGNGLVMQHMTDIIQQDHLATAVAGNCASACAMVFLSGETRAFADLAPISDTSIGFHGSYRQDGTLAAEQRLRMLAGLARETGGKADPELVQRWLHFPTQMPRRPAIADGLRTVHADRGP